MIRLLGVIEFGDEQIASRVGRTNKIGGEKG
jgi:hypothetical protein